MLLALASGNLSFRIPLDGEDPEFDEIAKLLNDFAEKMQRAHYENPFITVEKLQSARIDQPPLLIQKVQDYILNHLEEKLPSTKEFSQMFGTNEFTLKEHFRNLLKTSIYQFYNDERLKKAHLLIEHTNMSLGTIAVMSGFTNYTNFFKAFKKKYSYTPSDISRNTRIEDE